METATEKGHAVFVYGTLRFAAVLLRVTGTSFPAESARLPEYARHCFRDAIYPGIVAAPGGSVRGTLYREVDSASLKRLDDFEGDEFERIRVRVDQAGEPVEAWTYAVRESALDRLAEEDWNENRFVAFHLKDFLERLSQGSSASS